MGREAYRLTESVAGFPEGEVLDVTARFGDWHIYDMELEPRHEVATAPSKLVVSETAVGFSEEAVLDETARIGDWHEYDLAFEPSSSGSDEPTTLTMDDLETVTERVEVSG